MTGNYCSTASITSFTSRASPLISPDGSTLFLAVQHPAADGTKAYAPFGKDSSFDRPATRWPDFKDNMPARPAVIVVTRKGGGPIAGGAVASRGKVT